MPQVQAPKLTLPASFEQYPVRTTESPSGADGMAGSKQFDYTFIARVAGDFDIAPMEFTYFNPARGEYITLSSPASTISVAPDSTLRVAARALVSAPSKGDVRILGRDIRFIKLGSPRLRPLGAVFFGRPAYMLCVAAIVGIFAFLLVWLKKYLAERRNSVLLRGKRANSVALQRFRAAERYMKEENRTGFYEEILKALWGYMSDKLNIPVANLTKENIREELLKRGAGQDTAERYIAVIGECEYAQYAPAASARMNELYIEAVELVTTLETKLAKQN
jgi:hypothetical protein